MRGAFILAFLLASAVHAQPPAATEVDAVLRGCEKAMGELQTFAAQVQRVSHDKVVDAKDEHNGFALLKKNDAKAGGIQARLDLTKTSNKAVFERFICNGADLYEYVPAIQTVRVHKMPKNQPGDNPLMSFVLGMNAAQVKDRYRVELQKDAPSDGYHYLLLHPKNDADKKEFVLAQLVFHRSNHLLARVHYIKQHGSTTTWTFTAQQTNQPLAAELFRPVLDKGWRFDVVK